MNEIEFRAWDKGDKRWIPVNAIDDWKMDLDEYPYLVSEFFPTGEVVNERQVFDCKGGKTTFLTLSGKLVDIYPYGDNSHRIFIRDISNRFVLMQYTGFKDKNSKEIYTGDIVKFCHCDEMVIGDDDGENFPTDVQITVIKDGGIINGDFDDWNIWTLGFAMDADYIFEVIGNINENPELLNQKPSVSG